MLGLELADVVDREAEVGVLRGLGRLVDHHGRPDQPLRRHGGDVLAVATADPVDRRVEVRADVLADLEPVPRPGRAAVVVLADDVPREPGVLANGGGSFSTGVSSLSGWVRSTTSAADSISASDWVI